MSCGCNDPCAPVLAQPEAVASEINNLIEELFGSITKNYSNGRVTWNVQCAATQQFANTPIEDGEGYICYLLRVLGVIGVSAVTAPHSTLNTYDKNTIVGNGTDSLYISLQDVPVGIALSDTAYWALLITAPTGPVGPVGPVGPAASTRFFNTVTTSVNLTPTDSNEAIICTPAASLNINLSLQSAYLAGKQFVVKNTGPGNAIIVPTGPQTINLAATFTLLPNVTAQFASDNAGNWYLY